MTVADVTIPTKYVYVQSSEPNDKTEGKLWYNTSTNETYASDGSSYVKVADIDLDYIADEQMEQNFNILINSVASSSTLNAYDDMFVDILTDSDGASNTIDTGNTTALYNSDNKAYQNGGDGTIEDAEETDVTNTAVYVDVKTIECFDRFVSTATNEVKQGVTNPETVTCKYTFHYTDETTDTDTESATTTSYVEKNYTNPNPEKTVSHIVIAMKLQNDGAGKMGYEKNDVVNYSVTPSDLLVQTDVLTVTTGADDCQLYCDNTVAGDGEVTFDISLDNGSTWTEDLSLNTKHEITSTTGTQCIVKINLNGTGSGNTALIENYGLLLYYD